MDPEIARRMTEANIQRDPIRIVIERFISEDDGAGGTRQSQKDLPPQTVRIFRTMLGTSREAAKEGGQLQVQRWGLLARHDADITKGDPFEALGRRFRVADVDPATTGGQTHALHVDLEEVS